jgi:asparagine N-glycosylation enzyme membrane subunit Stt3
MGEQGFGGPRGGHCGPRQDSASGIEVSQEYTDNVNAILNSDTDVANLIAEGYNVTSIHPIVKSVVQGDGSITTAANTAVVTMTNGTSGQATVTVDVTNATVTQITTTTRTVIDKTSS